MHLEDQNSPSLYTPKNPDIILWPKYLQGQNEPQEKRIEISVQIAKTKSLYFGLDHKKIGGVKWCKKQKGMRACPNDQHGTIYNSRVSKGRENIHVKQEDELLKGQCKNSLK